MILEQAPGVIILLDEATNIFLPPPPKRAGLY